MMTRPPAFHSPTSKPVRLGLILLIALGFESFAPQVFARVPTAPANPFNARVITNAVVSPITPPPPAETRRRRHVNAVKTLQTLNFDNLKVIDQQISDLAASYAALKQKFDDLDKNDSKRDDLKKKLNDLKDQLENLNALQTVYQNNYNFLEAQLSQILAGK